MDRGEEDCIKYMWHLEAYLTHILLQQLAKVPKRHPRRVKSYLGFYSCANYEFKKYYFM
jgi:hypothetical protein